MKPFTPIIKPEELDFFSIYEDKGVKYIHIWGYTYKSDSIEFITEDNPDGIYWANMECCWFIEPLTEFIAHLNENESYVDETYCELKQYQGDYTEEKIVEVINHYFRDIVFSVGYPAKNEGLPDAYLDWGEITMDTPCGDYCC